MLRSTAPTPFDLVARRGVVQREPKREVVLRVRELEQLVAEGAPRVVMACLQDARFLTRRTREVYEGLAARGAQVTMFGQGLRAWLAPGVEGVDLDGDSPLVDQWTLVASGARSLCFAARDLETPDVSDSYRDFAWSLTADPRVVADVLEVLSTAARGGEGGARRQ